jgi:hypothetical protein
MCQEVQLQCTADCEQAFPATRFSQLVESAI